MNKPEVLYRKLPDGSFKFVLAIHREGSYATVLDISVAQTGPHTFRSFLSTNEYLIRTTNYHKCESNLGLNNRMKDWENYE